MLTKYLQRLINGILLCSLLFHIQYSLAEPIKVVVGIGIRPPFLSVSETSGAGPEILSVLNLVQKKYHFSFLSMPSHRKAQALEKGWIHISMWDNIAWGWSNNNMLASLPLVQSKDVFIALAADDRTQQYFENIPNKSMSWVSDYHYKIADFETDIDKLAARFDLSLVRNEESAIKMVLAKRVEISIVSESALYWFIKQYPNYKENLLISDKFDTEYSRHFLVSKKGVISTDEPNNYLQLADVKGLLAPIYNKYGLNKPSFTIN